MKKVIMVIGLVMMLMGLLSAETTKNELNAGFGVSLNEVEEKSFTLPYLSHAFEMEKDSFIFGLESEAMLEFDDEMENTFVMAFVPSAEYGFTEQLSATVALPLEYAESELAKSLEAELAFGNLEEDIEGITPWASFEEGFNISSVFTQEIAEDGENGINLNFDYSFLNKEFNFMLKPSIVISKSLSESDSDVEPNFSFQLAKDVINYFTFIAGAESDIDFVYNANFEALFYPTEKLEFSVSSGIMENDYEVGIGIDYLIFE